jgi:hypothetical protein
VASAVATFLVACSRDLPAEPATVPSPEDGRQKAARALTAAPDLVSASALSAAPPGEGVAVVELFTSEGCSSCPPADKLLAGVTARAQAFALPIYTLSFHVDYWNYLGWRDPFSSSSYSERQHAYAGIGTQGGTYTPQVVVNGAAECLGSDGSRLKALIAAALRQKARTQIELHAHRSAQGIDVDYRVSGDTRDRVLNLALLEPRAESRVDRGENANRHLAHVNVVRAFVSRPLSEGTAGRWLLPAGPEFEGHRVGLAAFAEAAKQRDVSGAAALELP